MTIGPFRHLTDAQRARSLRETFANVDPASPLWVFGYGSLIWRPGFDVVEQRAALLGGYSRSFSIYTVEARGTPEVPGLGLALTPGGECRGVVMRVADEDRDGALDTLWRREMLTGIYRPQWVAAQTDDGEGTALTFVADSAHPQYAGELSLDEQSQMIRRAVGQLGSCRDYLANTVAALARAGIVDQSLCELLARVELATPGNC